MSYHIPPIKRPNIFKVSTKELSQDAFITWLIQWANPQCAVLDNVLHRCGKDFLSLVMCNEASKEKAIQRIEAGRQWDYIDVWAEIFYADGTKTLLVIEDKVFSHEHSDQLLRYKIQAENYCLKEGFDLVCTYFKIGSEPLVTLNEIKEKGFNIITRSQIRACLQAYRDAEHSILKDFIEYIDDLEAAHTAFETLPPSKWEGWAWVGFYQYIEANLDVIKWHRVNNPNGGFWNLCLTWEYWNDCVPVYMQIEEDRICYKIALGEDETGLDNKHTEVNAIQDYVFDFLMEFAEKHGEGTIRRPTQFVHRGNYRTLAVIDLPDWCGSPEELANKDKIVESLKDIIYFYKKFMVQLNTVSFGVAEVEVRKCVENQDE